MKNEKIIKPNSIISPFEHRKWEIVGDTFEYIESKSLKKTRSSIAEFTLRYLNSFWGVFGVITIIAILLGVIIIPPYTVDPQASDVNNKYLTFGEGGHILGTDAIGRDLWAMLWHGLRFSIQLAAFVALTNTIIGIFLGLSMAKFKTFDRIFMTVFKIISNIPSLLIMIIIVIIFGASFWTIAFSLIMTGWMGTTLQVRAQARRVLLAEWVKASRVLGTPSRNLIVSLVPHVLPIIVTQLVFAIPSVILSETSLAFIGLSMPNVATLGTLILDGSGIITQFPRYTLIPSSILILIVSSVQFIGNATQDVLRRSR